MAGIPEQRCEANAAAEAQKAAPTALGADDTRFMRRAIELAWRGWGWTNPNPLVGCVLVRDGRIIGEGWHEKCGQAHAERNALADCARRAADGATDAEHVDANAAPTADPARGHARGATAYVTLEPCCHTGKQPPCTDALIAAGVARVVVGSRDPNPLVAGKGSVQLREAGIRVDEDALRGECDELNPIFFRFISRKTPYVVAKWAMSADGKIACASGDARWVSGPESRRDTHELRHRLAAIAVGINTVIADDPLLTCRREGKPGNQPLRVVLDSRLRIPEDCALVRSCTQDEAPLAVATCASVDDPATDAGAKAQRLRALGVEVLRIPQDGAGHVAVRPLLSVLGEKGIDSLVIEGGSGIHGAFFDEDAVDEAVVYLAPKVVGGADAPSPVAGAGAARMAEAAVLGRPRAHALGDDLKITFAPAGATRVADHTPASRDALDATTPTMQGGEACSPAS
ncbi:bifunctional diaminohydroxyphosphoribosylaminopyrimidine deaminase/5-amino-6-(5-phosphoribosylamino)uracil reductase RibD [Senegalimassilia anaerobia]|uniref:Riboflavin biosynthesis protein RibD n=1 Tax=Senegalimassilia anaerobia TaxID=1473216 RepID=A0A369LC88_9ACTN|nr:bifunctional diaminohydroxyphosphoribosylaminopyrimidine deaminase/5-amino-6-(5-phosphoribosylamino)uracil reductase RibD [Senegalimassilia anaerobia]RDB56702.1 bifunctional diaminohydroxyphosphoribosylaminopyrimidine deaminase/5-amino-6-(5-phosphoribosylamino)uracil reductase RibD [Senegalimassilia anaerobia]